MYFRKNAHRAFPFGVIQEKTDSANKMLVNTVYILKLLTSPTNVE